MHVSAIHEGKKSFECDICLKVLKTKDNLKLYVSASNLLQEYALNFHISSVHDGNM